MPLTSACQLLITPNSKLLDQKDARKILDAEIDQLSQPRDICIHIFDTHNNFLETIVIRNAGHAWIIVDTNGHFKIYVIVSTRVNFFDCLRDSISL